jgi:cyclopropane fatty-acyl-phospholipid synthase-like methyltransferase
MHWEQLPDEEMYDAIFTDGTLTHFPDLNAFFAKCRKLLRPGRKMAHKELHLSHSSYGNLGPVSRHIIKVFDYTGNYVTLHKELKALDENAFQLANVLDIPMTNYHRTVDEWLKNAFEHRERLKAITSPQYYSDYRGYLKAVRFVHTRTEMMQKHIVTSRKMS